MKKQLLENIKNCAKSLAAAVPENITVSGSGDFYSNGKIINPMVLLSRFEDAQTELNILNKLLDEIPVRKVAGGEK
jgi:hypothetical protein